MGKRLGPCVNTIPSITKELMVFAGIGTDDFVYDLGCGDGRLLIESAKLGARGVGYELNKKIYAEALNNVKMAKLDHLVAIYDTDALKSNLDSATVVFLYLSEAGNEKLLPLLQNKLQNGARVVTSLFPFPKHIIAHKIQ